MADANLSQLLRLLMPALPSLLICLVGGILAMVFWKRQPRVGLLVLLASVLNLIAILAGTFLFWYLPLLMQQGAMGHERIGMWFGIVAFVRGLIDALAGGLLLWAAFGWRRPAWQGEMR